MFVEQLTKSYRARLGSIQDIQDRRRSANGSDLDFVSSFENFANENDLPLAPLDTGLLGTSLINTPQGSVMLSEILPGQDVVTQTGALARVRHVLPAETPKTALRIRAPYFGANRDLIIGNQQYLEITSEVAEYMFNVSTVCVPAWVFKDNSKVLHHELRRDDRMYQLQLDCADGYGLGNCHVCSLITPARAAEKKFLDDGEARAFATERRIGRYN